MPFVNLSGKQDADATLAALAAWDWSSGTEVPTFTADDTLAILRVGTGANNLVQLNGSGELPAVSGANLTDLPSSGGGPAPHKPIYGVSTNVYLSTHGGSSTGSGTLSANTIYAVRIFVADSRTFTVVGCNVTTAFSASSTLRMAIVNENSDCTPGTLVVDTGTVAADSTGLKTFSISATLSSGWYWLLLSTNGTGGVVTAGSLQSGTPGVNVVSTSNHGPIQYLTRSLTYAAYGDQTGATWTVVHSSPPLRLFTK